MLFGKANANRNHNAMEGRTGKGSRLCTQTRLFDKPCSLLQHIAQTTKY